MTMMLIQSWLDHVPLWVWITMALAAAGAVFYFFSPVLVPLWAITPRPVKIALAGIGAALAIFIAGRRAGSQNERGIQKEKDARATKLGRDTKDEVRNLDPATRDKRIDRWLRD